MTENSVERFWFLEASIEASIDASIVNLARGISCIGDFWEKLFLKFNLDLGGFLVYNEIKKCEFRRFKDLDKEKRGSGQSTEPAENKKEKGSRQSIEPVDIE